MHVRESAALRGGALSADEVETLYVGLVRTYHAAIVGYIHSMVPVVQQAEDLTQDAFLKAYLALADGEPPDNPRAWLYRIATNTAIDHIRRSGRLGWVSLDRLAHLLRGADTAARVEAAEPLQAALAALAPNDRAILMLFAHAGLRAPEVAEVLGITPAAARKRRQRAREAFTRAYREVDGAV